MLLRPCFGSTDDGACKEFCRVRTGWRLSASGRKRALISPCFCRSEWPLSGKADIKPETPEIESENVRFTLGSGHSANIDQRVR
jgi:hypothetical protein